MMIEPTKTEYTPTRLLSFLPKFKPIKVKQKLTTVKVRADLTRFIPERCKAKPTPKLSKLTPSAKIKIPTIDNFILSVFSSLKSLNITKAI